MDSCKECGSTPEETIITRVGRTLLSAALDFRSNVGAGVLARAGSANSPQPCHPERSEEPALSMSKGPMDLPENHPPSRRPASKVREHRERARLQPRRKNQTKCHPERNRRTANTPTHLHRRRKAFSPYTLDETIIARVGRTLPSAAFDLRSNVGAGVLARAGSANSPQPCHPERSEEPALSMSKGPMHLARNRPPSRRHTSKVRKHRERARLQPRRKTGWPTFRGFRNVGFHGLIHLWSQNDRRAPHVCSLQGHCKCTQTQEQVSGRKKSHVADLPHLENRARVVRV